MYCKLVLFKMAGETLYGPRWQTQVARELGKSDRLIRYWLDTPSRIPDEVLITLGDRLSAQAYRITNLVRQLHDWAPDHDDLDSNASFLLEHRRTRRRLRAERKARGGNGA